MFNPAIGCELPKKERKEMKILPLDQLQTFFAAAKEHGRYEVFYFELATGLRRGELFGMKWSDIDFQTGAIRIQRQVQRLDGKVQETKLKTNNAYRTILVDRDILNMLLTMKTERKSSRNMCSVPPPVESWNPVFKESGSSDCWKAVGWRRSASTICGIPSQHWPSKTVWM